MSQKHLEKRLIRVMDYINANLDGDLSLDTLADVAAMSRFHFHRVFSAMAGHTLSTLVRRMRLYRAAGWLVQTTMPMAQIIEQTGLGSQRSFDRAFTSMFGLTPAAFRKRGELVPLPDPEGNGETTMFPVDIKDQPARRLAAMPHRGAYMKMSTAYEKLSGLLVARELISQTRELVGIFYDDPTEVPEADLRSHAAFVVHDDMPIEAPIEEIILPAGKHAVLSYKGPYSGLKAAYGQFYGDWLPSSGEEPADRATFEIYYNSPMDTAPDDLLTDLVMPLK